MNFDIKSLELFVRVASVGAIGKAGAIFGLSTTAASQRIQNLENAVGISLFHRTTRSVSLTRDGEAFLEYALRILDEVEDASTYLQKRTYDIQGEIRLACPAAFARKFIAPCISSFLRQYPKVSIYLDASDSVVDLVHGGFDLSVRLGTLESSSLLVRKIGESPRIIVASPEYLAREGQPLKAEDLKEHNCIIRGDAKTLYLKDETEKEIEIKVYGNFASNHAESITQAALSGLGIARKCKWEIEEDLKKGRLKHILDQYRVSPEWNIYVLRPPSRRFPLRIKIFIDFLEKFLAQQDSLLHK